MRRLAVHASSELSTASSCGGKGITTHPLLVSISFLGLHQGKDQEESGFHTKKFPVRSNASQPFLLRSTAQSLLYGFYQTSSSLCTAAFGSQGPSCQRVARSHGAECSRCLRQNESASRLQFARSHADARKRIGLRSASWGVLCLRSACCVGNPRSQGSSVAS